MKLRADQVLGEGRDYMSLCKGGPRPSKGMRRHIRDLKAAHRRAEKSKPRSEANRTSAGQMSKVSSAPSLSSDSGITATRNGGITITGKCEAKDVIREMEAKGLIGEYVEISQGGDVRHSDVQMQTMFVQQSDRGYIDIGMCSTVYAPITIERA